mmetsp:Transcript_10727/g.14786  ORF Transcript_10727/g.14786 Transcript_10727/m.14786 type:complete len:128 (+) Transcript_10727:46-429(+)
MSRKCFISHLKTSITIISPEEILLFGNSFNLVWIQGILIDYHISDSFRFWIDDGTDAVLIVFQETFAFFDYKPAKGDYLSVKGNIVFGVDLSNKKKTMYIQAELISKLNDPNLETLWNLEVLDSFGS